MIDFIQKRLFNPGFVFICRCSWVLYLYLLYLLIKHWLTEDISFYLQKPLQNAARQEGDIVKFKIIFRKCLLVQYIQTTNSPDCNLHLFLSELNLKMKTALNHLISFQYIQVCGLLSLKFHLRAK